ncbi:MAG: helix-turn-helix domain-containing protein [Nanoarchaeota archaeon]|nr:helix-turn-helix domain-containing protein [Nanoarchaeota archaeon]
MDIGILRDIGLTEGESKVYLALLRLGQTTTGPIVRKSGVTTSKSYKILSRLEEKGLVSHVYKNKVKNFKAASPEKVLALITQQFQELERKKKEVEKIVPELIAYQKQIEEEQEAEIYYGLSGLDTVFGEQLRTLKKGGESFVIGITYGGAYGDKVGNFFRRLQTKRDQKGIITNLLYGEDARGTLQYQEISKFCKIRYIKYSSLVAINVYNDITIICVFVGQPILFKIKSRAVADNFIHYFRILWDIAEE